MFRLFPKANPANPDETRPLLENETNNNNNVEIKDDIKITISQLQTSINQKQTELEKTKAEMDQINQWIKFLADNKHSYVRRHPIISLSVTLPLLLMFSVYLIYHGIAEKDRLDKEAIDKFQNAIIPDTTMTCGDFYSVTDVCGFIHTTASPTDEAIQFCNALLIELCHQSQNDNNTLLAFTLSGAIIGFLSLIAYLGTLKYACGKTRFLKDDRPLSALSAAEQGALQQLPLTQNLGNTDQLFSVLEQLKSNVSRLKTHYQEIQTEIDKDKQLLTSYEADLKKIQIVLYTA